MVLESDGNCVIGDNVTVEGYMDTILCMVSESDGYGVGE
jgi:hypothetical protein